VTVKVDGLHSVDKRDALIKALLGVKGVTSVTIDQRKGHAIM
jgi:copper chaperone CopZ